MSSPLDVLASRLREVPPTHSGVYLLLKGDEVVYVGSSVNVPTRVAGHKKQRGDRFDRALWMPLPVEDLALCEGVLIRYFKPALVDYGRPHLGRDNEILVSLGLEPHVDEFAAAREFKLSRPRRESWCESSRKAAAERWETRRRRKARSA